VIGRRSIGLLALSFGAPLVALGCKKELPVVCPADLRFRMSPVDTTIGSGEQFTSHLTLLGCAGSVVLTDTITYQSSDLTVAAVGTETGVVIGIHPGGATIHATARHYGVFGDTRVTVR
jgi:hypothetical protein